MGLAWLDSWESKRWHREGIVLYMRTKDVDVLEVTRLNRKKAADISVAP